MKKYSYLIVIFSLLFNTIVKADGIKDFEIEGISIGDSLLDHFSFQEIEKNIKDNYFQRINDNTFIVSEINSAIFNNYDGIQFIFKLKDKQFIIHGMHGILFYKKNISKCHSKLKKIASEISSTVIFELRDDFNDLDMGGGQGKYSGITFFLKKGIISVHCYDWAKKIEDELRWVDNLRVNIKTDEYENFLQKEQ
jgi:hypothetical protein